MPIRVLMTCRAHPEYRATRPPRSEDPSCGCHYMWLLANSGDIDRGSVVLRCVGVGSHGLRPIKKCALDGCDKYLIGYKNSAYCSDEHTPEAKRISNNERQRRYREKHGLKA